MTADQVLAEIREANLSYLMLAQTLIRSDREQALFRLGIGEDNAALINALTPAQMMKIASCNTLVVPHALRRRHGVGPAHQPRQAGRQRRRVAPARIDPDGGPPSGSRVTLGTAGATTMRVKSILTEAKQIDRAVQADSTRRTPAGAGE